MHHPLPAGFEPAAISWLRIAGAVWMALRVAMLVFIIIDVRRDLRAERNRKS